MCQPWVEAGGQGSSARLTARLLAHRRRVHVPILGIPTRKRVREGLRGCSHPMRALPAPETHQEKLDTTRRMLEKIPGQSVPYISRKSENRGNTITANIWAQDSVVPTTVITMILRQVNSPTALGQRYLRVFIRQIVKDRDILGADFRQGVSRGLWTAGKGQRKVRQSPRSPRQEVVAFEHTFATFVASLYFVQSLPNQPNQAPIPNNLIYHLSTRGRPACASSPPCAPRGGPGRGRPL